MKWSLRKCSSSVSLSQIVQQPSENFIKTDMIEQTSDLIDGDQNSKSPKFIV